MLADDSVFQRDLGELEADVASYEYFEKLAISGHPIGDDPGFPSVKKTMGSELTQKLSVMTTRIAGLDALPLQLEALEVGSSQASVERRVRPDRDALLSELARHHDLRGNQRGTARPDRTHPAIRGKGLRSMEFTFSEEQKMLRDSVSQYLGRAYAFDQRQAIIGSERGTSAEVWQQFREIGLIALPFPDDVGGLGGSTTDVVAISEVFGEHLLSEPYHSSVTLAGRALAMVEASDTSREWLTKIADGEALGAFAHEEGRGTADPARISTTATRWSGRLPAQRREAVGARRR